MNGHRAVRFGSFELDFASGELRSNGRRVALQGQPAQVLGELVRRSGEVVTREDLRRALWAADTHVDFDAALNVAINKIRQALHDSAIAPRFVETIPRRGYRFLADVHPVAAPPPPSSAAAASSGRSHRRRGWVWAVILTSIAGVIVVVPCGGARARASRRLPSARSRCCRSVLWSQRAETRRSRSAWPRP